MSNIQCSSVMIRTFNRFIISAICAMVAISATSQVAIHSVASPDGNLKLSFSLTDEGVPTYKIDYKDIPVVKTSRLGMELNEENSLMTNSASIKSPPHPLTRHGNLCGVRRVISATITMSCSWNWRNRLTDDL